MAGLFFGADLFIAALLATLLLLAELALLAPAVFDLRDTFGPGFTMVLGAWEVDFALGFSLELITLFVELFELP